MAKKRIEPSEPAPLKQNPFAALAAKKDEAPPAPPTIEIDCSQDEFVEA